MCATCEHILQLVTRAKELFKGRSYGNMHASHNSIRETMFKTIHLCLLFVPKNARHLQRLLIFLTPMNLKHPEIYIVQSLHIVVKWSTIISELEQIGILIGHDIHSSIVHLCTRLGSGKSFVAVFSIGLIWSMFCCLF